MSKRQAFKELSDELCDGMEYEECGKNDKGFIVLTGMISYELRFIHNSNLARRKIARVIAAAVFNQYPECRWCQIDVERSKSIARSRLYDYSMVAEYRNGKIFIKFFHSTCNIDLWPNFYTYSKAFLDERERAREKYGSRKCGIGRRQFKSAVNALALYMANQKVRSLDMQIHEARKERSHLVDAIAACHTP